MIYDEQWGELIAIQRGLSVLLQSIDKHLVDSFKKIKEEIDSTNKSVEANRNQIKQLHEVKANITGSIEIFGDVPVVGVYLIENGVRSEPIDEGFELVDP